jgi:flagellin
MALVITSNIASINAQRNLNKSTRELGKVYTRLSTGMRVNKARDDAASLGIAERMTSQVRGMNIAVRTANDAASMAQVAEGAMVEIHTALHRMRDLAVQASSDILSTDDRTSLTDEFNQLRDEVQRIAQNTTFNGLVVTNGAYQAGTALSFQISPDKGAGGKMKLSLAAVSLKGIGMTSTVSIGGVGMTNPSAAISRLDGAINTVSRRRAYLGAMQARFEMAADNLAQTSENVASSRSQMVDADIANETATLTKLSILQQAGTAILSQANQQPQLALQLLG